MKLNPSIKNMSNEYIFFTDQTALTFRICLVIVSDLMNRIRRRPSAVAYTRALYAERYLIRISDIK